MEDLLTPVRTVYIKSDGDRSDLLTEAKKLTQTHPRSASPPSTPSEVVEILRNEPNLETLRSALKYLSNDSSSKSDFQITHPSPIASQIVNSLVSDILPSYWSILSEQSGGSSRRTFTHGTERKLLLSCLRSISGLNAIVVHMKALIRQVTEASKADSHPNPLDVLNDHLDAFEAILHGDYLLSNLWNELQDESLLGQRALWHEITTMLSGGKALNTAAEASALIHTGSKNVGESRWLADGMLYSRWLARNIIDWSRNPSTMLKGQWKPLSEILGKSLRLGYPDIILEEILGLLSRGQDDRKLFSSMLDNLDNYELRMLLNTAMKTLSKQFFAIDLANDTPGWWKLDSTLVAGAAAYLDCIIAKEEVRKADIISWLTSLSGAGVGDTIGIRRAAIAVLSKSKYDIEMVLEKSMQQFGDLLYIKHAPSLQQEVHAQVLLLSAGAVFRMGPLKLAILLRSSTYLNAISNRLAATSTRARFLGMVVGEALSSLIEKPDKQMKFKLEELESIEAKWYKSLTLIEDEVGSVDSLTSTTSAVAKKIDPKPHKAKPIHTSMAAVGTSKIIAIQELDDDGSGDDDLVPYAKPDSDAEDSDEDPTVVQRNKPSAPVYIRDLITYLRDTENYDNQKLAISTAPSLIRRKANFGTEVNAHAEELASLLVGIQDRFELENFQDMRLQGMIAILLSQPAKMGKWFSKTFFDGDYSVAQRSSILVVLSMSARELGGFKDQDSSVTSMKGLSEPSFPSKILPGKLHTLYSSQQGKPQSPVDALSQKLSDTMIQPIAASVADKVTGPDILKIRTFSSRLEVEARRKGPTANALSAIVAESFFFPLTALFFAYFKSYGGKNVIFEPFLLSSFLKTLSLILHASGTSTLQLPQITTEFWDLLLSMRTQGRSERSVGEAVLFGFMTLLEINQDKRRLAESHGRELLETQNWVEFLFETLPGGSEEDDKARALAAGVLFKIREVIEKYQALLMGDMTNF